jgi:hypothetical protein
MSHEPSTGWHDWRESSGFSDPEPFSTARLSISSPGSLFPSRLFKFAATIGRSFNTKESSRFAQYAPNLGAATGGTESGFLLATQPEDA